MNEKKLPLTAHLEELRKRLIYSFLAIGVTFAICYAFIKQIVEILMHPLVQTLPKGSSLVFTAVPEAFFIYLKSAFLAGIFFSSPFILYQVWGFVSPGLYEREKKYVYPYLILSSIFFVGGALFCYFIVFPVVFRFFLSFASDTIRPLPAIREYLTFTIKLLLAFGLLFQWPVLVFFLSRMGVVSAQVLSRNRKFAILVIFVAAAVLTPPDIVSQLLLAGPLLAMYEGSIWMAKFCGKKEKREEKGEEKSPPSDEASGG
ncbi:MAG: twin-arginine translocase subunit TatC [Thermodesulfobacteriota bacterium]|nr:twin-arginine translocase subunit TatC [Thermodesulfobacteriota bacterium]